MPWDYLAHLSRRGTRRSYDTKLTRFLTFVKDEYEAVRFCGLRREHVKAFLDSRSKEVKAVDHQGDV